MLTEEKKQEIIEKFRNLPDFGRRDVLQCIPEEFRSYKCHTCYNIVDKNPCPVCGEKFLEIMCPLDHCECNHVVPTNGIHYCPICGQTTCPDGCHNNVVLTRVTGYYQSLDGFNNGKAAEVRDRQRVMLKNQEWTNISKKEGDTCKS